ncbi:MAG: hypothetical protein GPJ54_18615 [Candidatus Heimdallarchaeota archaeon]|nr:hypothetical protein [Candidatus Heimdallarchaeota archaeon]
MPKTRNIRFLALITLLLGIGFGSIPVKGVTYYTANVSWKGYNFISDTNCGDGTGNTCENKLRVKRTTSTSCSSRSWIEGGYEDNDPQTSRTSEYYYTKSWVRTDSAPCLTFDVEFIENSAGDATNMGTYTIPSDESSETKNLSLILGTANGYFIIIYWLDITDYPYQGPGQ